MQKLMLDPLKDRAIYHATCAAVSIAMRNASGSSDERRNLEDSLMVEIGELFKQLDAGRGMQVEMLTKQLLDATFQVLPPPISLPDNHNPFLLHTLDEWHDDIGTVIWWHLLVCEPPYIGSGPGAGERNCDGTPTTCARLIEEGWLTHWSCLPDSKFMKATDGAEVHT